MEAWAKLYPQVQLRVPSGTSGSIRAQTEMAVQKQEKCYTAWQCAHGSELTEIIVDTHPVYPWPLLLDSSMRFLCWLLIFCAGS